ncbi:MAG: thioredoxin domain-containing protein [Patescibacteria group bacterium]
MTNWLLAILIVILLGYGVLWIYYQQDNKYAVNNPSENQDTTTPDNNTAADLTQVTFDNSSHIKGNPDAPITIVEYSDTECPFCIQFHDTLKQVVEQYDGQVNWVYKHFPLDSLHPKARHEAEATECAAQLGGNDGFWNYFDRLNEITPGNNGLDPATLPEIATYVGLDQTQFTACLDSGKYADLIQQNIDEAMAAGGQGTPYSVIVTGDQRLPLSGALPLDQLQATIDQLL